VSIERVAAVDLGASTGRVLAIDFDGERLALHETHRFTNMPVRLATGLHWDVPHLFAEVEQGLAALASDRRPLSVGVDSWGVDYALLDSGGALLELPHSYRDARTDGVMEEVFEIVPREEIFARTGVQMLPFNTLYQLRASRRTGSPRLADAATLLTIADLVHHRLCGARVTEFTIATTTQCYEPVQRRWSEEILAALDLPLRIFPEVVEPGTAIGRISTGPAADGGLRGVTVVAPGSHDTASAVAATPLDSPTAAYISSGTWSLVGVERRTLDTSAAALAANFTNEGGVGGTYRFLRNITGLWLFEECRRAWKSEGMTGTGYEDLVASAARAKPFAAIFDPDDLSLLAPGDMPQRIAAACAAFGTSLPSDPGAVTRAVFEALALRYRWVLDRIARITGAAPRSLHVVGGGARNALLCQLTADVCGIPVLAGPVEATGLGNALVQLITAGLVASLAEGRELVRRSFPTTLYEPHATAAWEHTYRRFEAALAERR
jgi:rhamnulokinase